MNHEEGNQAMTGTPTRGGALHSAVPRHLSPTTAPPSEPDEADDGSGPPSPPSPPPRGGTGQTGRAERALGAALPAVLAGGVFAVAFAHVHDVARWARQPDWAAWLIAVSVELMAVASVIEIRHRHRAHAGVGWPVLTLLAGIGMSGAANLAAAGPGALTGDPGAWTRVMALWPVAAFALVAGLKATRPTRATPAAGTDRASPVPTGHTRAGGTADRPDRSRPPGGAPPPLPADLVAAGREVAADLARRGRPVTRTALARGVRARGQRCSTDRAALLLAAVRPADAAVPPPPRPGRDAGRDHR
jgi:hypothetical protein